MDLNAQTEPFSRAYVQAVAAVVGFAWAVPSVDDDRIDLTLSAKGGGGTTRRPKLAFQLKCPAQDAPSQPNFSYPLKINHYDDLRDDTVLVPRILVVVLAPDHLAAWLRHSEVEMALRRCGYWTNSHGLPATTNNPTAPVTIDRDNVFSPSVLT